MFFKGDLDVEEMDFTWIQSTRSNLISQFFIPQNWAFTNKQAYEFYLVNRVNWSIKLDVFRDKYPEQLSVFLSQLFEGSFGTKVANDWSDISDFEVGKWDAYRKIRFIRDTYEYSYQYLGLISFINNINDFDSGNVFSRWHVIDKAKEVSRKKEDSWKIDEVRISGKNWVIEKSPLLSIFELDVGVWKKVRNASSHNSIIVKSDRIFHTAKSGTKEITNEVNELIEIINSVFSVIVHFHMEQLILRHYWIYPTTLRNAKNLFNYQKKKFDNAPLDFDYVPILPKRPAISSVIRAVTSTRTKLYQIFFKLKYKQYPNDDDKNDVLIEHAVMVAFGIAALFMTTHFWKSYMNNYCNVQGLLKKYNARIDRERLIILMEEVMRKTHNHGFELMNIWATKFLKNNEYFKETNHLELDSLDNKELYDRMTEIKIKIIRRFFRENPSMSVMISYINMFNEIAMPINFLEGSFDKFIIK